MDQFSQVVQRYIDLVYAAARRQVRDAALAEDVTQAVFIILAQKWKNIPSNHPLSAWLLKTTTYCAANARRAADTRNFHERRAGEMARMDQRQPDEESTWEELSPLLDEGLNKLRASDRDAVLLKFFEKKTLRQVGEALGISEEAAGKRVARAVEKLRDFFRRRGATVSSAALGTMLMAQSTQAAPVALAGAVTAMSSSASAATVAKGAVAIMAAEKTKAAAIGVAVILFGLGGGVLAIKTATSSSSSARTVKLPSPATMEAALQPAVAPGPTFPIELDDGTTLEIAGLTDGSGRWWSANGQRTNPPPVKNPEGVSIPVNPGWRAARMVLRVTPAQKNTFRAVTILPQRSAGTAQTAWMDGTVQWVNFATAVAAEEKKTSFRLGLARGPWRELAVLPLAAATQPSAPTTIPGTALPRLGKITREGQMTKVEVLVQPVQKVERLEGTWAVLKDGQEIAPNHVQGTQGRYVYSFGCQPQDLVRLVMRWQAYEWITVSNVSLSPDGDSTSISVTRESLPGTNLQFHAR